jgi:ribosomal protein S18 acetylase RimI-like enzyme
MTVRQARDSDLDRATETITLAFREDPVWGVALARPDGTTDHHAPYWRMFVDGAHDQGGVWLLDDGAAVAVWIPPGGRELSESDVEMLKVYNAATLGAEGARDMHELYERFEGHGLGEEPFAYLSLLATHSDHRGRGIGQALLAENLRRWDELGVPCYLESTNPGNDHRYERAGFRRIGEFTSVRNDAPISRMWRVVGGAPAP